MTRRGAEGGVIPVKTGEKNVGGRAQGFTRRVVAGAALAAIREGARKEYRIADLQLMHKDFSIEAQKPIPV